MLLIYINWFTCKSVYYTTFEVMNLSSCRAIVVLKFIPGYVAK